MKKLSVLFTAILLITALCACSSAQSSVYTVQKGNTLFTVDRENNTISDDTNTYQYKLTGDSDDYQLEIIYPNGATYWWNRQTSGDFSTGNGGWSDDYDRNLYASGDLLRDVLEEKIPRASSPKNTVWIVILFVAGIFNAAAPRAAWYLGYGWRYKDAEPSDTALFFYRISGVLVLIVAVVMVIA